MGYFFCNGSSFMQFAKPPVVPYSISTSNHNYPVQPVNTHWLFLILFLHQTTTTYRHNAVTAMLFLILFLHQTTTVMFACTDKVELFLILFLHQTTTRAVSCLISWSCSLFYFYIKPQRRVYRLMISKKLCQYFGKQNGLLDSNEARLMWYF